ncbi:hypothetical protein HYT24_00405 [Candidatus Pacearchaeota archaeon]|nr:hypothetical protein [Candidatus Pacearchaeota archaeon]
MKVRTKKLHDRGIAKVETSGEIKEIIINEDFMNPKGLSVSVCFRGHNGSGIVDLTAEEINEIQSELSSKKKLLGKVKVMRFKK